MKPEEDAATLQGRFGDDVPGIARFRGEVTVLVTAARLPDVAACCRHELTYNFLSDVTGVDWLDRKPRFDVVYHLTSLKNWTRLRLKVQIEESDRVPTVIPVWPAANWAEREVWDMFGIQFDGHPALRRLLMPEGWIGHPLRKDYPQTQISLPRPKRDKTLQ